MPYAFLELTPSTLAIALAELTPKEVAIVLRRAAHIRLHRQNDPEWMENLRKELYPRPSEGT